MKREEWELQGSNRYKLFARAWLPKESAAKAVVCLAHGQGEHGDRYGRVAEALTAEGFITASMDHYGHGRSDGKRGHMLSMDAAAQDLAAFIEESIRRYPGLPVFLYGHSMGGNIALRCAIHAKPPLLGMIVTSPWLQLAFRPPAVKEWFGRRLASILPGLQSSTGLKLEDLYRSNEKSHPDDLDDSLLHTLITVKAYTEIQASGEWLLQQSSAVNLPMLFVHGTADRVTSYVASERMAAKQGSSCTWVPWKDGYHELHNDKDRVRFLKLVVNWLEQQVQQSTSE
ncbi:alpha/beta hydrolase [Paenibacillus sp. HB172176]|uniref:alpha/beta hydrolase n=1 Tax=Paenibacillus sp. HB172176 TaxID=2493690 RepID=UPI00143C07AF|nr:alpha/beta hydrolase [Paenibacillus sp. HB172176]